MGAVSSLPALAVDFLIGTAGGTFVMLLVAMATPVPLLVSLGGIAAIGAAFTLWANLVLK